WVRALRPAPGAAGRGGAGQPPPAPRAGGRLSGPPRPPDPDWLARVDALRDILTSGGRTLAQGALAWLWARSPRTVPIPGFRSVAQAEENAGAIARGPLTAAQLAEADRVLGR
ncbi:aldo/keto reductase, partial [Streptomyces mirabilis]|uniref:aldo/keto reductase n=1 Tax=Streptomyces mirabilis TaxID=68239 RepID=UPI0036825F07